MKKFAVSALAIAALAGVAQAQPVRLELRLVPQTGTLPGAITDAASSAPITDVGQSRRFEVQYRILDLDANDDIFPAGLTAGQMNVTIAGGIAGTFSRALISRFEAQQAAGTPPTTSDTSGNPTGALAGATGMHRPFRGGIPAPSPNNTHPSNGTIATTGITGITPLTLAQPDQGNNNPGEWYGLYSFEFAYNSGANGNYTITAEFVADSGTGNRFAFFSDANPSPVQSSSATAGTIVQNVNVIPAPGAMALLGAGGLMAARRRRTR